MILLVCYHAPHTGLKGNLKEENFKQFLNFIKDIKDKLKCSYLIAGVDSNLVLPRTEEIHQASYPIFFLVELFTGKVLR